MPIALHAIPQLGVCMKTWRTVITHISLRHNCYVLNLPAIFDVRRWGEAVINANRELFSCAQAAMAFGISTTSVSDSRCLPSQRSTRSAMHGVGEPAVARPQRLLGAPGLRVTGRRRRVPPTPHWCKPGAVPVPPHAEGERNGTSDDMAQGRICAPESSVIFPATSKDPALCAFRRGVPKPGQRRSEIPGPHLLPLDGPLEGTNERRAASDCAERLCSTALRALPSA
mmetsp:Transcript_63792/g.126193  ORF Transcript_63792/g.126193 Transcript_63792/m.126193 type:complete len:227 (-) Transcript_63792:914-1594(-)